MSYEQRGQEFGKLVDLKNKSYGDSVTKTNKLLEVFMEKYDNGDGTYTIPKSLLRHIGLMVRIMDKQNRVFSNPDGDLMDESPYTDILGYSMLGENMVNERDSN